MEGAWTYNREAIIRQFHTNSERGLSDELARRLLGRHGPNELKAKKRIHPIFIFLHQFQSPLIYVLVVASILAAIKKSWFDAALIFGIVLINSVIGYIQEYRAEQTMAKLRRILAPTARVIRDGIEKKIAARLLVPGDIILVEAGDRVPADARLIEAVNLRVNQASLTGESMPANKQTNQLGEKTALIDQTNMIFASTLVVNGRGVAVVVATAGSTEIGRIAKEVESLEGNPERLEKKINEFARIILAVVIGLAIVVFLIGLIRGLSVFEMIRVTISLIVSAVPEGLPVAMTIALSLGLLRVYRHRAIIRKLSATETLGSVTTICIDKTGTITQGQMAVARVIAAGESFDVTGRDYGLSGRFELDGQPIDVSKRPALSEALLLASLATTSTVTKKDLQEDRARELTDPTETALAVVAAKAGFYAYKQEKTMPELLDIPFDQTLRYSASLHQWDKSRRLIVKGAIERILERSRFVLTANKAQKRILSSDREKILQQAEKAAVEGYRVVAIAYVDYSAKHPVESVKAKDLIFVGLFLIEDPIRPEARHSIEQAQTAGIRVLMATGDHLLTAHTIAERVGLMTEKTHAIHAEDVSKSDLSAVSVIARATPEQKLDLVKKLQRSGEVVAMTGDGVNDAPALKKADIGVAMGRIGTDVAVEAADIVLLNDSLRGIVSAIHEGRLVWENLRKVIFYLVSTAFSASLITIICLAAGLPLPFLPVQLLWLNLVTGSLGALALINEPAEWNLMRQPPPPVKQPLISLWKLSRIFLISLTISGVVLFVFVASLEQGEAVARSVAFFSLLVAIALHVLSARSERQSILKMPLTKNPYILATLAVSIGSTLLALSQPALLEALSLSPLSIQALLYAVLAASTVLVLEEIVKLVLRFIDRYEIKKRSDG